MRSMYDLAAEWQYVFSMLEDEECDAANIIESCELIEADMKEKADNYGKIIRMLELEAQDAKAEASRLAARARTAENRAAMLRQSLFEAMKTTGQARMKTPLFSFTIQKNPVSVHITNLADALASGYIKEPKMDESILDKAAMKRDLEAGVEVPGAELVQSESLRMR